MSTRQESAHPAVLGVGGCDVRDNNYRLYRSPNLTIRVRVAGLTQLILLTPPGQPSYWLLELPWLGSGQSINLGEVDRLPPSAAKPLARKLIYGPRKTPQDGLTLKQFIWLYKRLHVVHLAVGSQMSIKSYSRRLVQAFGDDPITWITGPAVRKWHAEYSRRSPGGADEAKGLLRTLINCAKKWDFIPADHPNPCWGIRRNRRGPGHRSLSPDELQALGAALSKDEKDAQYLTHARRIKIMLFTGGRPGEIRKLRWEHVIFDGDVPSHLQIPQSKTGPRRIELNATAKEILLAQKSETRGKSGSIFPTTPKGRFYSEEQAKKYWHRLSRQAELPKSSRQYWLRHTYGTNSILAGGTLATAGALLGHKKPSTTQRYLHIPSEYVMSAGYRMSRRIADWMGLPEEPPPIISAEVAAFLVPIKRQRDRKTNTKEAVTAASKRRGQLCPAR